MKALPAVSSNDRSDGDRNLPVCANRHALELEPTNSRHAFDRTVVLRLGGQDGLYDSVLWLKSDNKAQAEAELAASTLDYTTEAGTLCLTWVHGMDVADQ